MELVVELTVELEGLGGGGEIGCDEEGVGRSGAYASDESAVEEPDDGAAEYPEEYEYRSGFCSSEEAKRLEEKT